MARAYEKGAADGLAPGGQIDRLRFLRAGNPERQMQNTLLVGLSQQMALRRNMDIIAHNLANLETAAYKAEHPAFKSYVQDILNADGDPDEVKFVDDYGMVRDTSEGQFERTSSPLDVAIGGKGYFVVETPDGPQYTRNGHFRLNAEGQMVSTDGWPVLDINNQAIFFTPQDTDLRIAKDGSISTALGEKGRLAVVTFENEAALERTGGTLYKTDALPEPSDNAELIQGSVEGSNVIAIAEITNMIEVMRAYDTATRLVKNAEDLSKKAISELGV